MVEEIKKFVVELEINLEASKKDEVPEEEFIKEMIHYLELNYFNKNESIKIKNIWRNE